VLDASITIWQSEAMKEKSKQESGWKTAPKAQPVIPLQAPSEL
jgi:hypothetical protein